jgi:hypothetical protein
MRPEAAFTCMTNMTKNTQSRRNETKTSPRITLAVDFFKSDLQGESKGL